MKIIAEVKIKGQCKHCGKLFRLDNEFNNHLAYEHEIYVSKWYMVKARLRKVINKLSSI
ncbi:hypothetical protein [Clostridium celatum]|uniref:hypothetical protein n=1 Tax=Clostridium celatum TaxID=36834 RepID=UPI00290312AC|nr:hypothetical protein [Clostridium celatum]MDU2169482.1 hypothetical protein [Clostridium perfringens]MDU2266912.1 hypothetical protein [Clostridium celatum]MDU6297463.1 hypothetical protein [Clostridium celatum]